MDTLRRGSAATEPVQVDVPPVAAVQRRSKFRDTRLNHAAMAFRKSNSIAMCGDVINRLDHASPGTLLEHMSPTSFSARKNNDKKNNKNSGGSPGGLGSFTGGFGGLGGNGRGRAASVEMEILPSYMKEAEGRRDSFFFEIKF